MDQLWIPFKDQFRDLFNSIFLIYTINIHPKHHQQNSFKDVSTLQVALLFLLGIFIF